jgi:hypothetical protein
MIPLLYSRSHEDDSTLAVCIEFLLSPLEGMLSCVTVSVRSSHIPEPNMNMPPRTANSRLHQKSRTRSGTSEPWPDR